MRRTIVISAVNIRKGGTLTILRECLNYLSGISDKYNVVALVHDKALCRFDGIEYIELPNTVKSWGRRLWCEYVTMNGISKSIAEKYGSKVYLWLSLHDTTPYVQAEHQAVYCQTSFPFLKWKLQDFRMDPKIPLFALFTKYAYKVNVKRNDYLIVQAQWLRNSLSKLLKVGKDRFIVAPVHACLNAEIVNTNGRDGVCRFLFPASGDCHKNFETICEAAGLLEHEVGEGRFEVILTINGEENRYTRWIKALCSECSSMKLKGIMSRDELFGYYGSSDCLIFPSRVETWGLPISEFIPTGKPIIASDLPFAHETTGGALKVAFFNPESAASLKEEMERILKNEFSSLKPVPRQVPGPPLADGWKELFDILLK